MGTYNTGRIAKQQWMNVFLNIKTQISLYPGNLLMKEVPGALTAWWALYDSSSITMHYFSAREVKRMKKSRQSQNYLGATGSLKAKHCCVLFSAAEPREALQLCLIYLTELRRHQQPLPLNRGPVTHRTGSFRGLSQRQLGAQAPPAISL